MRKIALLISILFLSLIAHAQDEDLQTSDLTIETRIDAFGLEQQVIVGQITNTGTSAYENISVYADLADADGEIIGEAFGFVVDECGAPVLDFPLQPEQTRRFVAQVDVFEEGEIDDIEVFFDATATEAETPMQFELSDAVTEIARGEVVSVEWSEDGTLRYGIGCSERIFTDYMWHQYDIAEGESAALEANPNEERITEAFIAQTGITQFSQTTGDEAPGTDPTLLQTSYLTFPSWQSRRIVYQTDIHSIITAESDGSFKRIVHNLLHKHSLKGFIWSPVGNFVAYYFGASGEPVYYFTASANESLISALLPENTPSMTVPGLTDDARRVIISGTFEDEAGEEKTGYWFSSVITQQREFLFEVDELAGNNFPAPAYYRKDNVTRYIYLVRPVDGVATLQCFHYESGELNTLTELPLQLSSDERAWSWLSPDNSTLAIAANGNHGGLWLVDLTAFEACQ